MRTTRIQQTENDDEEIDLRQQNKNNYIPLKDKSGFLKKRTIPRVIRFRRFNILQDPENYFREMIMLYMPWREESEDLVDCESKYNRNLQLIQKNRKEFNAFDDEFLEAEMRRPSVGHDERVDYNDYDEYRPDHDEFKRYVLLDGFEQANDFGDYERRPYSENFSLPDRKSNEEFRNMLSSLNNEQRDFVTHVISHFKNTQQSPIFYYLKGEAGVGKSHVINTLYEGLV